MCDRIYARIGKTDARTPSSKEGYRIYQQFKSLSVSRPPVLEIIEGQRERVLQPSGNVFPARHHGQHVEVIADGEVDAGETLLRLHPVVRTEDPVLRLRLVGLGLQRHVQACP